MMRQKDLLWVSGQLALFLVYLFTPEIVVLKKVQFFTNIGFVLMCLGAVILVVVLLQLQSSLSPFPSPRKATKLVTTGLFKWVRHPIYTGILIILFGYSVAYASLSKLIITIIFLNFFYWKAHYEETLLTVRFPAYKKYKTQVGMLFPKIKR